MSDPGFILPLLGEEMEGPAEGSGRKIHADPYNRSIERVRLLKDHWVDTPEDPRDLGFWVEADSVVDVYDGPDEEGSIWFEVDSQIGLSLDGDWEQQRVERLDPRDMRNNTWILCGGCERIMDGVPYADGRITVDGLMMIREAGWEWTGISWECDGCAGRFLEEGAQVEVHGRGWMGLLPGEEP